MILNINSNAVVSHTNRLEKLHKSALPIAIRETLNEAAFDVKTNTMPQSAKDNFTQRDPKFFKANSKYEKASGFNVNSMKSTVGFYHNTKGNNHAVDELEEQESGGTIEKRSFIPLDPSRKSGNKSMVRPNYRLKKINNIVDARNMKGKSAKQKFVFAAFKAGVKGNVLSEYKGKTILWKVNSLRRNESGGYKLTPIYSFKKGRKVNVDSTNFMQKASLKTAGKMEVIYVKQAQKQFYRLGAK